MLFILIQLTGLAAVGRDYYGVFPLRGKLLNVREDSSLRIKKLGTYSRFLDFSSIKNTPM